MKPSERLRDELLVALEKAAEPHRVMAANLAKEHGDWCALRYLEVVGNPNPPTPSPKTEYKHKRKCFCPECGGNSIVVTKTSQMVRAIKIHLRCEECGAHFSKQDNHNGVKW